jgi:hypothetical protein
MLAHDEVNAGAPKLFRLGSHLDFNQKLEALKWAESLRLKTWQENDVDVRDFESPQWELWIDPASTSIEETARRCADLCHHIGYTDASLIALKTQAHYSGYDLGDSQYTWDPEPNAWPREGPLASEQWLWLAQSRDRALRIELFDGELILCCDNQFDAWRLSADVSEQAWRVLVDWSDEAGFMVVAAQDYEADSSNMMVKAEVLLDLQERTESGPIPYMRLAQFLQDLVNWINNTCIDVDKPMWPGGPPLGNITSYNEMCGAEFSMKEGRWEERELTEAEKAEREALRQELRAKIKYWQSGPRPEWTKIDREGLEDTE